MRCIIIDDEKFSREILSVMIFKSPNLVLVGEFENAIEAIKFLNDNNAVDLIFLDIHMPNFTGFDFIKTIKSPPQIILVTTDKNFAIEAFNYDCIIDYLLKPITEERFAKAVQKAKFNKDKFQKSLTSQSHLTNIYKDIGIHEIYVNIDKRLIKIDIAAIKYIHANGDYIVIKTETINYTVHTTLKKIEEKLPKVIFLKIHRSYIINLNKIIDIQDSTVLIGSDIIPISKNNRTILMESLNLL